MRIRHKSIKAQRHRVSSFRFKIEILNLFELVKKEVNMFNKRHKGFTLIELLIVVSVIAVLAAMAIPNFLEAQIRSKVSRVKSDLSLISTALEAYFVDNQAYPPTIKPLKNDTYWQSGFQLNILTTPISYLAPFTNTDPFESIKYSPYKYINLSEDTKDGKRIKAVGRNVHYLLISIGPDVQVDYNYTVVEFNLDSTEAFIFYDPTNGTVSAGEIVNFGD